MGPEPRQLLALLRRSQVIGDRQCLGSHEGARLDGWLPDAERQDGMNLKRGRQAPQVANHGSIHRLPGDLRISGLPYVIPTEICGLDPR
jgi:hypothetical protein